MARFETLGFGDARDVILRGLRLVAGPAEDLKVFGFVGSAQCNRDNVINVPSLAGADLLRAACANPFPLQEEVQPKRGREDLTSCWSVYSVFWWCYWPFAF